MDFLIKNGNVYDGAAHRFEKRDIALVKGRIAEPDPSYNYRLVVDAGGCIVAPGLIDYHVHCFQHGDEIAVSPEATSFCCGITTLVDGGSCGAGGYELFRRTAMSTSSVRILSYLLAASGGQSNDRYPENLDPRYFDEDKIVELFARYRSELVGLKTRISKNIIDPSIAEASLARTVEIAEKAETRVIVHVTDCSMPLDKLAGMLRPGDVICHIYQNRGENTCLDADGKVLDGLWAARKRGVLFDASNGRGNYDLNTCRAALAQGFVPDVISSDMNYSGSFLQPLHSLPRVLSKYLDFGMSLEQVLDAAVTRPAELIGRPELASMTVGTPADVAIFELRKKPVSYFDVNGNTFDGTQVLVPMMTFKDGECMYCQADFA